ncbi:MAG: N4-gp56 family major capsid protein [Methanobrevibacter sp.]|nr:N4-gp56 family major capsid protein [Methanobrevibacter sp.]
MAITRLTNLINPEVIADFVDAKLVDNMVFAPLATVDYTLEGRAGDTLKFPVWRYIGDASTLSEASTLSVATLVASSASVTVHKIAQGVELTDEAVLSGLGDPVGEAVSQITLALASGIDNEMLATMTSDVASTMTYQTSASTVAPADTDITDALELFGEDIDGTKAVIVPPAVYTKMRKTGKDNGNWIPASELSAEIAIKGAVGEYQGCQVIVSNKLKTSGNIFIVKPNALRLIMKRGAQVETDRDILKFSNVITGSVHFATYVYNASGLILIKKHA